MTFEFKNKSKSCTFSPKHSSSVPRDDGSRSLWIRSFSQKQPGTHIHIHSQCITEPRESSCSVSGFGRSEETREYMLYFVERSQERFLFFNTYKQVVFLVIGFEILWVFFSMVRDDKGIFHVCSVTLIPQAEKQDMAQGNKSSWGFTGNNYLQYFLRV